MMQEKAGMELGRIEIAEVDRHHLRLASFAS
jgi:hypothetical protein